MGVEFRWDQVKARSNFKKHRVSFDEATSAFFDPLSITIPDPAHSEGEHRYLLLGMTSRRRLLVIAHTDEGETIRIISARVAEAHERRNYENVG